MSPGAPRGGRSRNQRKGSSGGKRTRAAQSGQQTWANGHPSVLRDLALLADGERGAVIGPQGDIVWLCVPRWHDEPVFTSLLGGHGAFTVTPADPWHVWGGSYEPASLVWRSRWVGNDAVIECDEALSYPADDRVAVLLRRVRAVSGAAHVTVDFRPVAGFHGAAAEDLILEDGVWTGRAGDLRFRVSGLADAHVEQPGALCARLQVPAGEQHDIVVEFARGDLPEQPADADHRWVATRAAWGRVVPRLEGAPARGNVRQSYAVLTGLTSADHGMVAAATLSLPERAREGRNYDYRYAWIRDQCYTGQAIAALGPYPLLDSALSFVTDRILEHGADLRPAYTVTGESVPDEHHADLPGYPGGGDVVGNWVNGQFQLDTFGEALSMYAAAARHDLLQPRHWEAVRTCVAVIDQKWGDPEAGVWELDDDRYTQSRLACVAGLSAIARHAAPAEAGPWLTLADRILLEISDTCLHPSGRWQQSPTQQRVDASLVLPTVRGALAPDDPRSAATREAVLHELSTDGHVYRFRHDDRPLADAEGSFTLCGLIMALALAQLGRYPEAVHYFERARAACTNSGLYTEEYDTRQHQLRGNLPQAFVHAFFIEASVALGGQLETAYDVGQPQEPS